MIVKVKRTGPREVMIEVRGETYTLLDPLTHMLHRLEGVEFAGYDIPHPLEERGILYVRSAEGDPVELVLTAVKMLREEYSELKSSLIEELKRVGAWTGG